MTVQVKATKLNIITSATGTPTTTSNVVPFLIQQNPPCPAEKKKALTKLLKSHKRTLEVLVTSQTTMEKRNYIRCKLIKKEIFTTDVFI